ncbi:SDR family NAD(P)-dependent oxidoreductase [Paraglaciecola hydrolytica]|uniref:3-oxoacyl-ACP reductase n=1 Tax=Paraglaciecola hydrolytica TaxID=1799789 RepID=A0A136A0J4_9ALTE|nr:glucose 1-dehydrogenase [Paraglaciecola hydrolytica]KXI28741.1 3-oxoacyl-ACP reductase [Paraglaciecola hydrolytica]
MDELLDFSGQVALITGAGSGFGRLLTLGLVKRGCRLVISDIDENNLAHTLEMAGDKAAQIISQRCDVANENDCKAMVDSAIQHFGRVDIAVNNAGVAHDMTPLHLLSEEILDKQWDINVKGVLFGMKYQIAAMLSQGSGHILNVSSMAGIGGAPKVGAYAAAKHAVAGLTKTAAVEYAKKGIRCNAICPFFSPTAILKDFDTPESQAQLARGTPMKRLAQPQEIVNTMLLMLSPGNSYMNGQTIAVDGGVSAW